MTWRVAKCLLKLREQVDAMAPARRKASDGTIGDAGHASRTSDHNPWVHDGQTGIVTAMDITHDPKNGCDCFRLSRAVISDPRVKYVIWNRQIYNRDVKDAWRAYHGANGHTLHMHVSVKADAADYDNESPWNLTAVSPAPVKPEPIDMPTLSIGSRGAMVGKLQHRLNAFLHANNYPTLYVDWIFGQKTAHAVGTFQRFYAMVGDEIAGPYLWQMLDLTYPEDD